VITPARAVWAWLLAAGAVAALSAASWSGTARPWDDVELWQWTVGLALAGAVAGATAAAGPRHLRFTGAAVGAVLTIVAAATWLREWSLLALPSSRGWWGFEGQNDRPVFSALAPSHEFRAPTGQLTPAGYVVGGLLAVALVASVVTTRRLWPRRDQSAAG
jgi:hypothetical protein